MAHELHQHQELVNVAHPHAPRDEVAQALVGGGEALPRCHALLQALSQAVRDDPSLFPCVGCTNITELLK